MPRYRVYGVVDASKVEDEPKADKKKRTSR